MKKIEMSTLLTLIASFLLSAIAYNAAHADDIDVTKIAKEVIATRAAFEVLYNKSIDKKIVAQADEADDGDGENIDWMNDNWCLIHPDDVICQEQQGEEDEEGC